MRSSNAIASPSSNVVVHSYLMELRNIALKYQSLGRDTLDKLKKAGALIASRRIQRQKLNEVTDRVGGEGDQKTEYALLSPDEVAIADNMIVYQQFGGYVFCAPQEPILEGECG